MDRDLKSVKPTKDGGSEKEEADARLHLIPSLSTESTEEVTRPRKMTVEEARWIAGGKRMKVIEA